MSDEANSEHPLLPAVREADETTLVLADGFSCRTQIHELDSNGRTAVHLAELLADGASALQDRPARPEQVISQRPPGPGRLARASALLAVAGATVSLFAAVGFKIAGLSSPRRR